MTLAKGSESAPSSIPSEGFRHPLSLVESANVGKGTRVWAFAHILPGAVVGEGCNIAEQCFIESGAVVGNGVTIENGVYLWRGITLENGVFVGPRAVFTNDRYPRSPRAAEFAERYQTTEWLAPTLVKRGASIGAGAVIAPGLTLGEYCMVGAGAVVTHDVPPHGIVVGNPARLIGWVCRSGSPIRSRAGV